MDVEIYFIGHPDVFEVLPCIGIAALSAEIDSDWDGRPGFSIAIRWTFFGLGLNVQWGAAA